VLLAVGEPEGRPAAKQVQRLHERRQPVHVIGVDMRDDDPAESLGSHAGEEELLHGAASAVHEDGVAVADEDDGGGVALAGGDGPRASEKREVHGWSGGGAGPAEEQGYADQREDHADHARELGDAKGTEHESVRAEGFGHEAAHGVEPEVSEEEGAGGPLEAPAKHEEEKEKDDEVPDRLVEERRMEILVLGKLDGPVRR
jgi:hypothetical protein